MTDITTDKMVLQDHNHNTGKDRPWQDKRKRTFLAQESLSRLDYVNRSQRMSQCSLSLIFYECRRDGFKVLKRASFCRDRLCPMCSWRRSLMYHAQLTQILHKAFEIEPKARYLFLTLTVRNVKGCDLSETLDAMYKGFDLLVKYREVDKHLHGYIRNLEITYNEKEKTFHPHFHVLLCVSTTYFSDGYIPHKRWVDLWRRAMRIDYDPRVEIKAVRVKDGSTAHDEIAMYGAIKETAKYPVKDSDYIKKTPELTDRLIGVLAVALRGRRLIGFGKMFRLIRKELKLADIESTKADLIGKYEREEPCLCPICQSVMDKVKYDWSFGVSNFVRNVVGGCDID